MNKTSIFKRLTFEQQRLLLLVNKCIRQMHKQAFLLNFLYIFFSFWMHYIVVISYGSSLLHYDLYSLDLFKCVLVDQQAFCCLSINNIRHFFLAQRTHFFCREINAVLKLFVMFFFESFWFGSFYLQTV